MYLDIIKLANKLNCVTLLNEELKKHTSFKIGGPADLFIYINNTDSLKILLNAIKIKGIPFFVLGNGTNLLVSD